MKRYIRANTGKEGTFVRFGKRFRHGKSINYLAMNPRIKHAYSVQLANLQYGNIDEDEFNEWCERALEDYVWEPNTSCFYYDPDTDLPVVNNVSQAKTLIGFIQRFEGNLPCQSFVVQGTQVGTGTDKEPLVNVTYEEEVEYSVNDLINVVIDAFQNGFLYSQRADTSINDFEYLGNGKFQYKNWIFEGPRNYFIHDYEYNGKVMDKFKYETEVAVDYDNVTCAHIDAESNGGKNEVADCIWDWESIYDRPEYFENKWHIVLSIDKTTGDIDICGSKDDVEDFLLEYPIDAEDIELIPKLVEQFKNTKFYE